MLLEKIKCLQDEINRLAVKHKLPRWMVVLFLCLIMVYDYMNIKKKNKGVKNKTVHIRLIINIDVILNLAILCWIFQIDIYNIYVQIVETTQLLVI